MKKNNVYLKISAFTVLGTGLIVGVCSNILYQNKIEEMKKDYIENPIIIEKEIPVEKYVYITTSPLNKTALNVVDCMDVKPNVETPKYYVSKDERDLIAKILWLEGRGEEEWCQKQIVSVIMNRQIKYGSIYNVIYAPKQFTTAKMVNKARPTEETYAIVDDVIQNGSVLPWYVMYFRANRHATWKGYRPYNAIDNTYFGYSTQDYNP